MADVFVFWPGDQFIVDLLINLFVFQPGYKLWTDAVFQPGNQFIVSLWADVFCILSLNVQC